jgi:hypothetical protein
VESQWGRRYGYSYEYESDEIGLSLRAQRTGASALFTFSFDLPSFAPPFFLLCSGRGLYSTHTHLAHADALAPTPASSLTPDSGAPAAHVRRTAAPCARSRSSRPWP